MTQSFEVATKSHQAPEGLTSAAAHLAEVIQLFPEPEATQMDTAQQIAHLNALCRGGDLTPENRTAMLRGMARYIQRTRAAAHQQRQAAVNELGHIEWED